MITFYPFCFSKFHSLKFGEIILSFIRPKENSVFAIHDTKALKLLIRRRLKVTHLSEHKFRHSFRDTGDNCKLYQFVNLSHDQKKTRSSRPEVFCIKGVLRNFTKFTGKRLCQSLFFNKVAGLRPQACNVIKKETLTQTFSYEFYKISKNTFS